MSVFFSPQGEVSFYLPPTELPFLSVGVWSPRLRVWVPLLFTASRECAAGQAARLAEGGFDYWVVPVEADDEALEVRLWRSVPPFDSEAFRLMLSSAMHSPDDLSN